MSTKSAHNGGEDKDEYRIAIFDRGGGNMRADWADDVQITMVLAAMRPENSLAIAVSDATGLRINDVLSLRTDTVLRTNRPYVTDRKTGKSHQIRIPEDLRRRMLAQAGKVFIWPGRLNPDEHHRTPNAVYKDMARAVAVFRRSGLIESERHITPHTARKRAGVRAFRRGGWAAAAKMLQHQQSAAYTAIYALADVGVVHHGRKHKKSRRAAAQGGTKKRPAAH